MKTRVTQQPELILRKNLGDPEVPDFVKNKIYQHLFNLKDPTPQELKQVDERLRGKIKVRDIEAEAKQEDTHFVRRVQALQEGVEFLIQTMAGNRALSETQRSHLTHLQEYFSTLADMTENNINLSRAGNRGFSDYRVILADYVQQVIHTLSVEGGMSESEATKALSRAEEYALLSQGRRPAIATVTRSPEGEWTVQLERPEDPLSADKKREFLQIVRNPENAPEWFHIMPEQEQALFLRAFKGITEENIDQQFPAISSKLRSIPGVANFSHHLYVVFNNQREVETETSRFRSSMIASRDIASQYQHTRSEFAEHNLEQIIQVAMQKKVQDYVDRVGANNISKLTLPILAQTLITPWVRPDEDLYDDKQKAISRYLAIHPIVVVNVKNKDGKEIAINVKPAIISTNHPLNPGRYITPTGEIAPAPEEKTKLNLHAIKSTEQEMRKLVQIIDQFIKDPQNKNFGANLEKLEKIKTDLVESSKATFIVSDRELHLAALEEAAVSLMGGVSYGSCVSGKDRKAIETIYADSLIRYLDKYKKTPPMELLAISFPSEQEKEDRKNFVNIYAGLYQSRHQHENAGQNAIGADALKTPHLYLPNDILDEIEKRAKDPKCHKKCDKLASLNEPKKIKNKFWTMIKEIFRNLLNKVKLETVPSFQEFMTKKATQKTDAATAKTYIAKIKELVIGHDKFWHEQLSFPQLRSQHSAPTGILELHRLFDKQSTDLSAIREKCDKNLQSGDISSNTREFYNLVRQICIDPASQANPGKLKEFSDLIKKFESAQTKSPEVEANQTRRP